MQVALVLLLGLSALVAPVDATSTGNPVGKVVELIRELQSKITADGKAEQKIYDKYACWCENMSARKANAIHQAHADIKSLSTSILELKGLVATRASEITQLSREIRENQESQDTATAIRQKENTAYQGQKAEMEQTLNALERGIKVLMGAGTGGDESLLQTAPQKDMEMLKLGEQVHTAMTRMPADHQLTPAQMSALMTFTKQPADYHDQKAKKSASFSPQSATIQGILKDMYDTFSMNLEKATETEATQQKNYEDLMAVKTKEMGTLTDTRRQKEESKATAETDLATASQELDDTTETMKADTQLFDDAKAACTAKAAEWNERVRARSEELAGIAKALEILTSDENRALFTKSIKPGMEAASFLQTSVEERDPRNKAFNILKSTATHAKSLRLAALAAKVRTSTTGHFDAVIVEIDKMIAVMQREEKDDTEERDWCKEETFKNEQEAARLEYKIEKHETKLMKLNKRLEDLETTKAETVAQILQTNEDISKMEDNRIAEHKAFEEAKSDDEQASTVLGSAIEALGAFYKNNDIDQGEIQGGAKAALVQAPEFEVSEDQAPDASFSSAGKSGGESKGIVSIMTMIKEDLEDEIKNGVKTEKRTQAAFENSLNAAKKLVEDLTIKKTNLESDIATTNDEINDTTVAKEDTEGLLHEEREYLASIKPDCDFMLNNYEKRRAARGEEIDGLITAKGMLAGAAPPSMVQKSSAFDDDDLPKMTFSAVSFLQRQ
jgi:predicted  nucleic acid-binding Zn-ribbon protein